MLSESLKTLKDTADFPAKIHSLESTKDKFKENDVKKKGGGNPCMMETAIQARIAGRFYSRYVT
jgi:hypothetical protein